MVLELSSLTTFPTSDNPHETASTNDINSTVQFFMTFLLQRNITADRNRYDFTTQG